jgi:ATP adenylyltransferase/5',5'''-P-1,P-4-tetraphosphate phosphorylase II
VSRKELVLLASRTFALLLTSWAMIEVTYLADHLFALSHYLTQRSALAMHDYLTSYYLIITASNTVRMLALFFAAAVFWQCGPRVEALFSPQQDHQEQPE